MILATIIMIASMGEISPAIRAEIDRRVDLLPATQARKERVRNELLAVAEKQALAKPGKDPATPSSLPLSNTEIAVLKSIEYTLVVKNRSLLKSIVMQDNFDYMPGVNQWHRYHDEVDSYAWMSLLAVYMNVKASPEYTGFHPAHQKRIFLKFARRQLLTYFQGLRDEFGDSFSARTARSQLRNVLAKRYIRYGRPPSQREVEILLRLLKVKFADRHEPRHIGSTTQKAIAKSWQNLNIRPLRDADTAIETSHEVDLSTEDLAGHLFSALEIRATTEQFEALRLVIRGLSYNQVATIMSMPLGTVKSSISRTRILCQQILDALKRRKLTAE